MIHCVWAYRGDPNRHFRKLKVEISDFSFTHGKCSILNADLLRAQLESDSSISHLMVARNGNLTQGYAIFKNGYQRTESKQPVWYIDFFCAQGDKGLGTRMMQEITDQAQSRGVSFITLHALPHAIVFYLKQNFQFVINVGCSTPSDLADLAARIRAKISYFDPPGAAFEDEQFVAFLRLIVHYQLTRCQQEGTCADQAKPEDYTKSGVYMTLCLPSREFEVDYHSSKRQRIG
jgi:hypothetical protein